MTRGNPSRKAGLIGPAFALILIGASGPEPLPQALPEASRVPEQATPPLPPASTLMTPLVPGQVIQPIDLASALRLAGARDLDIATARQQVLRSLGELDQARGLWLPSLFTGPTYYRLDGQVQAINGQVQTVHRDSLSLGTTATLANSFPAPPPGSGYPPLNSLSGVLRFSDAIYGTRAARRVIAANDAGVKVATNDALAGGLRGLLRSPARRRFAGHRPRGRRQLRATVRDHRHLRPIRRRSGGRPPPDLDRTEEPSRRDPGRHRPFRGRLGQPGPAASPRSPRRHRAGRTGRDGHPACPTTVCRSTT